MIPDDDIAYLTLTGYEQTDLTVYLPGEFGKVPCQFMGEYPLRGDFPPAKLSDPLDLTGLETGSIAINPVYFRLLLLCSNQFLFILNNNLTPYIANCLLLKQFVYKSLLIHL